MVKRFYYIIFVIALIFFSCKNQSKDCLLELGVLKGKIDSADSIIYRITDMDEESRKNIFEKDMLLIKSKYPDTIPQQLYKSAKMYKKALDGLDSFSSKTSNYKNEVDVVKEQYESLKKDIEEGTINNEKIRKYINIESSIINNLSIHLQKNESSKLKYIGYCDTLNKIVNSYFKEVE